MKQEANAPMILTIGAVSAFLVLVTMFGTEAWFRYEQRTEETAQWDKSSNTWLDAGREPQKARLLRSAGPVEEVNAELAKTWPTAPAVATTKPAAAVEKQNHLPIDAAMDKIIEMNGQLPTTQPAATSAAVTGE